MCLVLNVNIFCRSLILSIIMFGKFILMILPHSLLRLMKRNHFDNNEGGISLYWCIQRRITKYWTMHKIYTLLAQPTSIILLFFLKVPFIHPFSMTTYSALSVLGSAEACPSYLRGEGRVRGCQIRCFLKIIMGLANVSELEKVHLLLLFFFLLRFS